jgi:hypothetical protein
MDLGRSTPLSNSASYETSFMTENLQKDSLPTEVEVGNVEYKVNPIRKNLHQGEIEFVPDIVIVETH